MTHSKDVKLESDGAVYYFKFLGWDTDFFGKKCFLLDCNKSILKPSLKIKKLIYGTFRRSFITAKIASVCGKDLHNFMQTAGFKYIDTQVTLGYNVSSKNKVMIINGAKILALKENRGLPYKELGSAFSLTRFHYDVNISGKKATSLWINYIKNYKISTNKHIFIAEYNNKIVGAILVNEINDNRTAVLDIVAVIEKFRGKKIGSQLIQYVTKYMNNREILVETESRNTGALNFYVKNGFSMIVGTKTVYHRW